VDVLHARADHREHRDVGLADARRAVSLAPQLSAHHGAAADRAPGAFALEADHDAAAGSSRGSTPTAAPRSSATAA
jgi:hypothetical protein